jgi:hypothetical protein
MEQDPAINQTKFNPDHKSRFKSSEATYLKSLEATYHNPALDPARAHHFALVISEDEARPSYRPK